MKGNPGTIKNIQSTAQALTVLVEQYRVDSHQASYKGLKWLENCFKGCYDSSEKQLSIFIDRLLFYETDPSYAIGAISGTSKIKDMLTRNKDAAMALFTDVKKYRVAAYEADPDYTTDLFEHLIRCLEEHIETLSMELELLAALGDSAYTLSRIEGA